MVLFVYYYNWEEPASIEYSGTIVVTKSLDKATGSCVERRASDEGQGKGTCGGACATSGGECATST